MNRDSIILTIKNMTDIDKLNDSNIKYLNIDITTVNKEVLDYLKKNGQNYLYTESIGSLNGYIYVDYDTFFIGQKIIDNIISNIPSNLSKIEIAKYLYISLGKSIGYDINSNPLKNETFNFKGLNTINNIWGALSNLKATNQSFCKVYLYLCSLMDIKCDIVTVNNEGYLCNKLSIENNSLIVDLTSDIPFIQTGFMTRCFSNYNDELDIDKKIGYVKDNYNDIKIERVLKNINQDNDDFLLTFLIEIQNIINITDVCPIGLGIVCDILFHKYVPNLNITINNLYINDNYNNKEHFILISYNDNYYCYNYNKKTFIKIYENELISNIESDKIGLYLNEEIPIVYKNKEFI